MSDDASPGRPPKDGRFPKGKSGNPKGRPRRPKQEPAKSAFDIILEKKFTLTHRGEPSEISAEEALQHKTYQDAIAGKITARRKVLKMIAERERWLAARQIKPSSIQMRFEAVDPTNANEVLLILGIAVLDPQWPADRNGQGRLSLQLWAVEAALRRRGRRSLSKKDIEDCKLCTRNAQELTWPESTDDD